MTRPWAWMPLLLAALLLGGCAARGNVELLEARLRQQEDALREMHAGLRDAQAELVVARREAVALRDQLAERGQTTLLPEQAGTIYRAAGIQIHRFFSGGLDNDGRPGDDLLSAMIVPQDAQGELVKVPGSVRLELFDMSQPENERLLGRWNFDPEDAAGRWHAGMLGSGYVFRLPWQKVPRNSELLLHARLTTPDGRRFDTSRTIRITPPPAELAADAPQGSGLRQLVDAQDPPPARSHLHAATAPPPVAPSSLATAPDGPRRIEDADGPVFQPPDLRVPDPADLPGESLPASVPPRPRRIPPPQRGDPASRPSAEADPPDSIRLLRPESGERPAPLPTSDRRTEWTMPVYR